MYIPDVKIIFGVTNLITDVDEADLVNDKIGELTDVAADTASTATMVALLRQIAEAVNNGAGASIAAGKSLVDYIGAASTSSLVARLGALTDVAVDTTDTATIIALLRQIAEAVNKGAGTPVAAGKSLVDALGTDGTTVTDGTVSVLGAIGVNNADNAFVSSAIVANVDGSVLERLEHIKDAVATADGVTDAIKVIAGVITDSAADTASTATVVALLRQIAEAVNNGTGTAIAANTSLVDYIGPASVSSLVARLGALTDVADETASTATIINQIRAVLARAIPRVATKTLTFDGTANKGATGAATLFTVTGCVKVKIYAVCTTGLTPAVAGATLELGTPGSTAGFIAQALAADLIAGELWDDATPTTKIEPDSAIPEVVIGDGADITLTVATQAIASGVIEFRVEYMPISSNGALVAV
jgi:hypothetical protein